MNDHDYEIDVRAETLAELREFVPYAIASLGGAAAPIVSTRYAMFGGDVRGPIDELLRWLAAGVICIAPIKRPFREWPLHTLSFYGGAAGCVLLASLAEFRDIINREKELENEERLRALSLDSSLL